MPSLRNFFRKLFDRRKRDTPVQYERRNNKFHIRDVDERLRTVVNKLEERTSRLRREDLERATANDAQQVVIFSTFRDICQFKGPQMAMMRFCRHPNHPDAANSVRICEEDKCPKIMAALKGAA